MLTMIRIVIISLLMTMISCSSLPPKDASTSLPTTDDIDVSPRILDLGLNFLFGQRAGGITTSVGPVVRSRIEAGCRRLMGTLAAPLTASGIAKDNEDGSVSSSPPTPGPDNKSTVPTIGSNGQVDRDADEIIVNSRSMWWRLSRDPYYGVMNLCTQVIANQGTTGIPIPAVVG